MTRITILAVFTATALLTSPISSQADDKFTVRGYGKQPCTELQGMPENLTQDALLRLPLAMQLKALALSGWVLGFASAEDEKAAGQQLPGRVSPKFADWEIVKATIMACEKSNSEGGPYQWTISDATMVGLSGLIMQSK
jgi:hypothetical protein